jgi:hypothetical protein
MGFLILAVLFVIAVLVFRIAEFVDSRCRYCGRSMTPCGYYEEKSKCDNKDCSGKNTGEEAKKL